MSISIKPLNQQIELFDDYPYHDKLLSTLYYGSKFVATVSPNKNTQDLFNNIYNYSKIARRAFWIGRWIRAPRTYKNAIAEKDPFVRKLAISACATEVTNHILDDITTIWTILNLSPPPKVLDVMCDCLWVYTTAVAWIINDTKQKQLEKTESQLNEKKKNDQEEKKDSIDSAVIENSMSATDLKFKIKQSQFQSYKLILDAIQGLAKVIADVKPSMKSPGLESFSGVASSIVSLMRSNLLKI